MSSLHLATNQNDQHFSLQITAVRMSAAQPFKDRNFLAVIGDEVCPLPKLADSQDSVTGLLLAGIGHITQDQKKNFLIVDASRALQLSPVLIIETELSTIEKTFEDFTMRKDVAILLINQHVWPRPFVGGTFC